MAVDPITGTSGNDDLSGTALADEFRLWQGGDDSASGLAGDDTFAFRAAFSALDAIDGGTDNDTVTLKGDYSSGVVFGAATMTDVETLILSGGFDYALTTHDATVAAGAHLVVDASRVNAGHFLHFDGYAELDGGVTVIGTAGNDVLRMGGGGDTVFGGTGRDYMHGNGGDDGLSGGPKRDVIQGGEGGDTLHGGKGNDTLYGEAGDDAIQGDAGMDRLLGAGGDDVLMGGIGPDRFVFIGQFGDDNIGDAGTSDWTDGEDLIFTGYASATPTIDDVVGGVLITLSDGAVASSVMLWGATTAELQLSTSGNTLIVD